MLKSIISNTLIMVAIIATSIIICFQNQAISASYAILTVPNVYILNSSNSDYIPITSMFTSVGFKVSQGNIGDFHPGKGRKSILVVPHEQAIKLSKAACASVLARVKSGDCLITTGNSGLSKSLGIAFTQRKTTIRGYLWRKHPEVAIAFAKPIAVDRFQVNKQVKRLATDVASGQPVAVCGRLGKGSYFYSGIALAPADGSGYEHFPFILEAVRDEFHIQPVLAKRDLSVYLDLAYHRQESPRRLAEKLHRWGINRVHCSTWYATADARKFMRDFIAAAHDRGIVVYAWLELPMVSKEFWDGHPECREQTASGADAKVDWRYHIALEDARCFDLVIAELKPLMMDLDWDGIDFAELYFESPLGLGVPESFTPMHRSFREDFQKCCGVDPQEIFRAGSPAYWKNNPGLTQRLVEYRISLITQLNTRLLEFCEQLRIEKPHLRNVMTVIDTITDAAMKDKIGIDAEQFVKLQNHYGFDLEIEDPYTLWNLGPKRYQHIGEQYRSRMLKDHSLSIDINIVDRQDEVYPTKKQRGLELLQLINAASSSSDKVILYGLSTLEPADMYFAKYAHGQDIVVDEHGDGSVKVKSNKKFFWKTAARDTQYYVDGNKWPFAAMDEVMVPAGEHAILGRPIPHKEYEAQLRIEDVNGEILSAAWNPPDLWLEYTSSDRLYVTLNQAAALLSLDGKETHLASRKVGSKFLLALPQGRHQVRLRQAPRGQTRKSPHGN
jgi:hypothetical protein